MIVPSRGYVACVAVLVSVVLLGGCTSSEGDANVEEYVLAFQVTEERRAFIEQTEPLAEWISDRTGVPTRVLTVQDDRAQITALATGQAHAAYMSGGAAWIGWQEFDLEAVAAEVREADGRTSYVAGLWVLADGGIDTIEDLRGRDSCHTGELTGTGMFVPLGYLIGHGYVDTTDVDRDDIASLSVLRERFFANSKIGGGYAGAFQCLSTGEGEVATGRDTAAEDFCGEAPAPWCRPVEDYRFLPAADGPDPAEAEGGLVRVPSHPVMVSPHLHEDDRRTIRDAFLALDQTMEGRQILRELLGAAGLEPTTAAEHLGRYGEVLDHVPGIRDHFANQGQS